MQPVYNGEILKLCRGDEYSRLDDTNYYDFNHNDYWHN